MERGKVTWLLGKWAEENPWEKVASLWKGYSCWELLEKLNPGRMPLVLSSIRLEAIKQFKSVVFSRVDVKDKGQRVISFWPGRAHKKKIPVKRLYSDHSIVCMSVKQYVFISNRSLFLLGCYMAGHKLKWPHRQVATRLSEAGLN